MVGGVTRSMGALLGELEARLGVLENHISRLRGIVARLPTRKGCTPDYRWVRGNGGIYYYWYLVCYEGGRRRHIYVGYKKEVLEDVMANREAAELGKALARKLRGLYEARFEAERRLRRAEELIREALQILDSAIASIEPMDYAVLEARAKTLSSGSAGEGGDE